MLASEVITQLTHLMEEKGNLVVHGLGGLEHQTIGGVEHLVLKLETTSGLSSYRPDIGRGQVQQGAKTQQPDHPTPPKAA